MMYYFFVQQLAAMKMQAYEDGEDNIIDMELYAFIIGLCLCFGSSYT